MKKVVLNVEGMSCGHCSATVQKALEALENVTDVHVDLEGRKAHFSTDDDSVVPKAVDAVTQAGYKAEPA
ncbi:MAG: heavy-metal-associated domain-containing protein [Desulfarculaceae bacterium]|nr:heavy-metal-associated domain-containing protein [Desulfarculaceae bacterium]